MAFEPYRHMECAGIPFGYDNWKTVSVVRRPLGRMFSLYMFLKNLKDEPRYGTGWLKKHKLETEKSFSDWLVSNETPFNTAMSDDGVYNPFYAVQYDRPETRKSQKTYLFDDTLLYPIERLDVFARDLGLGNCEIPMLKSSFFSEMPDLKEIAHQHLKEHMGVDKIIHENAVKRFDKLPTNVYK
jgi:hypothetical protein